MFIMFVLVYLFCQSTRVCKSHGLAAAQDRMKEAQNEGKLHHQPHLASGSGQKEKL
jgi:hypothetical protein